MVRTSNGLALCVCVCATYLASYLALPAHGAAQAPDPDLVYHTLRTPHFDITYHDPLGELAQRLAVAAERANSVLSRQLRFRAQERTLILLTDDADDANGVAGVIPRNEIHLFAAAPDDLSPLGDYDDWIATIVTHEHTHVLHLDQIGGTAGLINAVLGKTVAPNALQPRWFIEGLATYAESAHSAGGRMRSSMYDMFLRMDALSGELWSLAQLSNDPHDWPHGEIRYLYGSRFVEFIARHHGDGALSRMGAEYGSALLPYGLNRVAKHATGFTFVELYDRFRQEVRAHYLAQRDRIVAPGLVEGAAIVPQADLTRGPRFLRDGRLAFYREDGRSRPQLRTLDGSELSETSGDAALANSGVIYRPHLVKYITDTRTGEKTPVEPEPLRTLPWKPQNIETIKKAMVGVNKEGTGARAFAGAAYESGGKTGTAQVFSLKGSEYRASKLKEELRDHALFIAFAPADHPTIALAVLVENGGFGAQSAAPIARMVLDYYLLGKLPKGPAKEDETPQEEVEE